VKEINTERLNRKLLESLASEISVLQRANHPHIVNLYETIKRPEKSRIYLVLEYCSGSDLSRYMKKHGRLSEERARYFMRQLCDGLKHLRALNLMHRDLKPQNLLLSPGDEDNKVTLKIADFGFARDLSIHGLADTLCGSPLYMAPEILQYKQYDVKADLWSVGAILYELVCGTSPFSGSNHIQLLKCIEVNDVRIPDNLGISRPCKHLIRCLLKKNPIQRLSFEGLFTHPFITGDTSQFSNQLAPNSEAQNAVPLSMIPKNPRRGSSNSSAVHKLPPRGAGLEPSPSNRHRADAGSSKDKLSAGSLEREYVLIESPQSGGTTSQQSPASDHHHSPSTSAEADPNASMTRRKSLGSTDMFRQYAVKSSLKGDNNSNAIAGKSAQIKLAIQRPENKIERILLLEKCAIIIEAQAESQENPESALALYLFGTKLLEECLNMLQSEQHGSNDSEVADSEMDVNEFTKTVLTRMDGLITKAQNLAEAKLTREDCTSNNLLPDAMELIYAEALALARKGAVEEIMGNYTNASKNYFCALNLLFFICTEAKEIPMDKPLALSPADQARVYNYIVNIQDRYTSCAQDAQK